MSEGRRKRLTAYRAAALDLARTVEIGRDDCAPWVTEWIFRESGRRVALPAYGDRAEGWRLADQAGGAVALARALMRAAGFAETDEPQLGDVGMIRFADRDVPVIFANFGFALIRGETAGAPAVRPRQVLAAWSIPEGAQWA